MAFLYNYPIKTQVSNSDRILISDSQDDFETKQITIGSIPLVSGSVSSFSGGTTGLLPNTAEFGDIVLSGVLGIGSGGTEATTAQEAINNITSVDNGAVDSVLTNNGTDAVWKSLPTKVLLTSPNGTVYELVVDNDGNLGTTVQGGESNAGGGSSEGDGSTGDTSDTGDTGDTGDTSDTGDTGDTSGGDTSGGDTGSGDTGGGDTGSGNDTGGGESTDETADETDDENAEENTDESAPDQTDSENTTGG
jgi:hypothetical protein